ncbi:hypothetical protein K4L44_12080 [Halosquirtibacter laminarini]|uniref:Uncharacterized protein n=1 Tax=Halosquirtibacter laminarini TaxID=3374600 RepID=A0AC61NMY4_9BACT|nr:hypothetical protein K4L44_12080 [Prolixibacteraceae bacterium]
MSITILHNKDINREMWDNTINESSICSPTLQSWYLDIVCPDWQAVIKEDYSMVMPIVPSNDLDQYIPYSGIISIYQVYSEDVEEFISILPTKVDLLNLNPTNWLLSSNKTKLIETEQ